jgi:hypothetical protein
MDVNQPVHLHIGEAPVFCKALSWLEVKEVWYWLTISSPAFFLGALQT